MANGQAICDKCKCFLREDGGCTHCERSALLSGPLRDISKKEAVTILSESVEVSDKRGNKVVFKKEKLLTDGSHLRYDHEKPDYDRRIKKLRYCIEAVKTGKAKTKDHINPRTGLMTKRTTYKKDFTDKNGKKFKAVAITDKQGSIREVFTIYAN